MNLYAYVGNDPVNWTDPSGLSPEDDEKDGRPKKLPGCTGTRIPAACVDGVAGHLSPGTSLSFGGGSRGFDGGGYVCVKNCGPAKEGRDGSIIITAPRYEWVSSNLGFYVSDGRYLLNPYYSKHPYSDAFDTAAGMVFVGPMAVMAAVEAAPVAAVAARFVVRGREIPIGRNWRMAPFGNRTGHPTGRWPHYHRRGIGPDGTTRPGQSIRRHRPWDQNPIDSSWWDRF